MEKRGIEDGLYKRASGYTRPDAFSDPRGLDVEHESDPVIDASERVLERRNGLAVGRPYPSHLINGQFADRTGSVGCAVHPAIMEHDGVPISRRPDIDLDEVHA